MRANIVSKGYVTLTLSTDEALALAAILGRMNSSKLFALGLDSRSYDELADALEYGDNAPYPYNETGGIYKQVSKLQDAAGIK